MTNDAIIKFIETKNNTGKALNIHFKSRSKITGLFIQANDYQELKTKNFWRIVTGQNIDQWKKTRDMNLCRIFNGMEFTRISVD